jgi:hypothetical protein
MSLISPVHSTLRPVTNAFETSHYGDAAFLRGELNHC